MFKKKINVSKYLHLGDTRFKCFFRLYRLQSFLALMCRNEHTEEMLHIYLVKALWRLITLNCAYNVHDTASEPLFSLLEKKVHVHSNPSRDI